MWLYIPSNCLPASACLASDCEPGSLTWASRLAPSVTWSGSLIPPASWRRAWKTAHWMTRLSGPTYAPSTLAPGVARWIASLAASRAKTCPLQAAAQGWTASEAGSFLSCSALPKIAVRDTSFWRTSAASLLPPPPLWTRKKASSTNAQPPASWENWPTAGGTRNGSLFQRPKWAPAMGANGGSAGRGEWPTPQASAVTFSTELQCSGDGRETPNKLGWAVGMWLTPNVPNGGRSVSAELVASKGMTEDGQKRTVCLSAQTKYWATPTSSDNSNRTTQIAPSHGVTHGLVLAGQAASWNANSAATHSPNPVAATDVPTAKATGWPTPRGTDGTKGGPNQAGSKGDLMLPSAAAQWPTPAARDSKGPNSELHAMETGGGRKHMDQLANFVAHSSHQAQPTQDGLTSLPDGPGSLQPSTKRLNPYFTEWLMGWPEGWTSATALPASSAAEMALFHCRLRQQLSSLFAE